MKTVYIHLLSDSMGDTIASTPYVLEYSKKHNVKVYFGINDPYIFLLKDSYPNIVFIGRNVSVEYDEKIEIDYVFSKSVQGGYAEQLGLDNTWEFVEQEDDLMKEKGYVARFNADSDRANLYCVGDPANANASLGVRFVRETK